MADQNKTPSHTWKEVFEVSGFNLTIIRKLLIPVVNATPFWDPNQPNQVAFSKDVPLDSPGTKLKPFIRLYIPVKLTRKTKLPLIIYIHGGGFISLSVATVGFHDFCNNLAARVRSVVVAVEHRLAPEHPLPAAYKDTLQVILWLKSQALYNIRPDPWLHEFADFSRVFIMGESSGGNIAYHAALRASELDLRPLKIEGVILDQPFFGGVERTSSELRLIEDPYLPLYLADALWSLALPFQANRDHEFSNPFIHGFERVRRVPRWFVKDDEEDPMIDRVKEFVRLLELHKVPVVYRFYPGGFHGMEIENKTDALPLFHEVKNFIYNTGAANY
ncbi:putative carboxylesterase [Abeliophyllum distichum]|uniref:Carboxylesterase n=1 Tax=Abeliophyllum distichum TaxID=126358 RepID=A0ABD1RUW8_9LAMI